MGGKLKDEKKGNHRNQFVFTIGSSVRFQSFRIHNSMNVKNVIEKL